MSLFQRASRKVVSYRLGYSPQLPYPWRWTTPVVLGAFLLLSAILSAINVPLSAYELGQELTYRPNDTLPPLPLSNLIPIMFQHQTSDFSPQILTVGNTIQLNSSDFAFTIVQALDVDTQTLVPSFSYYNNPFSDACDVDGMTATIIFKAVIEVVLTVDETCRMSTDFELNWSWNSTSWRLEGLTQDSVGNHVNMFYGLAEDLGNSLSFWALPQANSSYSLNVSVEPWCAGVGGADTSMSGSPEMLSPTQPPCSSLPTSFSPSRIEVPHPTDILGFDSSSGHFPWPPPAALNLADNTPMADVDTLFKNTFQALYHLVRLELGVILDNQIYASPEMYNRSISSVNVPNPGPSFANVTRLETANGASMAAWMGTVLFFQNSDRVPIMMYLRPVPRFKPLASAVTGVFVSTLAMLSVLWTVFSLIAGTLVRSSDNKQKPNLQTDDAVSESGSQMDLAPKRGMQAWDSSQVTVQGQHKSPQDAILDRLSLAVELNATFRQLWGANGKCLRRDLNRNENSEQTVS
ncbi:hypothetical protein B0H19DRAFT_1262326 [Mycena capillaripes]|nr:hypothetical protein B0H19DRAFT_1262326 [Mycena capillaripes]